MKSFVKWSLEICFGMVMTLSIFLTVMLVTNSKNETYYAKIYERNWLNYYITDLIFTKSNCPNEYPVVNLGIWSGFNEGCYCINQVGIVKLLMIFSIIV